jgi:hypothetical protein
MPDESMNSSPAGVHSDCPRVRSDGVSEEGPERRGAGHVELTDERDRDAAAVVFGADPVQAVRVPRVSRGAGTSAVCRLVFRCSGYRVCATEGGAMTETGQITGTKDKDYNIIWFTEACLSNALRLENYIQDADREGDQELAEFFRRAQNESRKGAEQGKQLLASRIAASS